MDKLRWRRRNGCHYPCWRHVPALASNPTPWCVVPLHDFDGSRRVVARHRGDTFDILHYHRPGGESWNMDISAFVC